MKLTMLPVVAPVRARTDSTLGTRRATMRVPVMIETVMMLNVLVGIGSAPWSSIPDDCQGQNPTLKAFSPKFLELSCLREEERVDAGTDWEDHQWKTDHN